MATLCALVFLLLTAHAAAQIGTIEPLAQVCNDSLPSVVCVNRYAAVMPFHFYRQIDGPANNTRTFGTTSVPNDTSFGLIEPADFLVFDKQQGLELLGPSPTYDFIYQVQNSVHEAPVYEPNQNLIYFSQLAPPPGQLPQYIINLNVDPPTLEPFLSEPPVYAPNGGTFHNGLIYWGASGGNNSVGGMEHRVGLETLDPNTNKTTVLLNNYFGFYFNTIDDLFVHPNGDIWFTDPQYSWFNKLTDTPPQLQSATYRFRPSTGAVYIVEDALIQPNGIALSPDLSTVYITDTGAETGSISPFEPASGSTFNATTPGGRTIYAYNISADATYLFNKRPFYFSVVDWIPDGLKVAGNGYVVTAAGRGVDIIDRVGTLLARVQTNFTVNNFVFAGKDLNELWMFGQGGIAKACVALKGSASTN